MKKKNCHMVENKILKSKNKEKVIDGCQINVKYETVRVVFFFCCCFSLLYEKKQTDRQTGK